MSQKLAETQFGQTDEQLLDRFLNGHDDEAFAQLVARHGPMILGVCRRLSHNASDAEDAFQATFLTLIRKGHTIQRKMALANWLYRVAVRIALGERGKVRERGLICIANDIRSNDSLVDEIAWREAAEVLDRELRGLPEKYRTPLILCCIEGRSYGEVASELDCPMSTVAVRLMRGRELLRKRLVRRGILAGAALLGAQAVWSLAQATVPHALAVTALEAANAIVGGKLRSNSISPRVLGMLRVERRWWRLPIPKPVSILVLSAMVPLLSVVALRMQNAERKVVAPGNQSVPAAANVAALQEQPAIVFEGKGMRLAMVPARQVAGAPPVGGSKNQDALIQGDRRNDAITVGAVVADIQSAQAEPLTPKRDDDSLFFLLGRIAPEAGL
jgi:RNA polymerase sigma factor (sigma-70 family)